MKVGGAGAAAALRSGHMANKRTLEQARKEARARLLEVQQKEAERERLAVEDAAAVVRARTRREDVDGWEARQLAAVAVEADRKRVEHERTAIDAVQRMRGRGETVKTIALLCGVSETEVRKYVRAAAKAGPTPAAIKPGALGAADTDGVGPVFDGVAATPAPNDAVQA